jgi:hypothetical protein
MMSMQDLTCICNITHVSALFMLSYYRYLSVLHRPTKPCNRHQWNLAVVLQRPTIRFSRGFSMFVITFSSVIMQINDVTQIRMPTCKLYVKGGWPSVRRPRPTRRAHIHVHSIYVGSAAPVQSEGQRDRLGSLARRKACTDLTVLRAAVKN